MPSLGMSGPYVFTRAKIDEIVTKKSEGNYALGYVNQSKTFIVQYVGRSDSDVNAELKNGISTRYKSFKCSYASSPKAAFEKECRNYHDFGGSAKLHNKIHPARPANSGWKCPVCNKFG